MNKMCGSFPISVLSNEVRSDLIKYEASNLTNPLKPARKTAFTLAEILITLGIIGVVAALTLPALIVNIQEKTLESQLAKAKNTIANGYKLMMSKNSVTKTENLPFLANCNGDIYCIAKEHRASFSIIRDTAAGLTEDGLPPTYAVQGETDVSPFKWSDVPYIMSTGDGIIYGVIPDEDLKNFSIIVDINGGKKPNTVSKDLYKLRITDDGAVADLSSELAEVNKCKIDNPSGCTTGEACNNMILAARTKYNAANPCDGGGMGYCFRDSSNECKYVYGRWDDDHNECNGEIGTSLYDWYCN